MSINLQQNINCLYIIKIAKWFMLIMPIIVPFYRSNELGMQDVFILQAVYSVAIVILEIPSGYLADVIGRKDTLVIGTSLGFTGFLIYCFTGGFWGFLMAEVVLGMGQSLISGADSAMLYDSLLNQQKSKEYLKYEGRMTSVGNFAEAAAGILGGLLASITLRTPFFFQTGVAFLGIPAALMLIEPERYEKVKKLTFKHILSVVRFSVITDKYISRNIFFSAIIGTATLTMAWFVQPYFSLVEVPISLFGVLWTLLNLSVGLTAIYAYRIEKTLGKRTVLVIIAVFIPLGYFLLSYFNARWAILFIFLFYLVRGFASPILKDHINRGTSSDIRATVLSMRNFLIRFVFALTGPVLGWLTDIYSLQQALLLGGIVFLALGSVLLVLRLNVNEV